MLLVKRALAYIIDYIIISALTIVISIILYAFVIEEKNISDVFLVRFSVFFVNYKLTFFWLIYEMLSILILPLFVFKNNGLTIGDKILNIKVKSSKLNGLRFYFLRLIIRESTVFFAQIFVFINLIYMIMKRSMNVVWYDGFLGINVKE